MIRKVGGETKRKEKGPRLILVWKLGKLGWDIRKPTILGKLEVRPKKDVLTFIRVKLY